MIPPFTTSASCALSATAPPAVEIAPPVVSPPNVSVTVILPAGALLVPLTVTPLARELAMVTFPVAEFVKETVAP